ncbi:MAG TPA: hypothetical protein VED41_07720 [Solirubrobacteraceae bacterium]|nr:hypothetical protein [Solirubrobacteraceae bacterium]
MTVALRLLSRDQLNALDESQLHKLLCNRYHARVVTVLSPLAALYAGDPKVSLGEVQRVVAERLRSIEGLEAEVSNASAAGGLSIREKELWAALACWVVENQLDARLHWNPGRRPKV